MVFRIVALTASTGTGSRDLVALDDLTLGYTYTPPPTGSFSFFDVNGATNGSGVTAGGTYTFSGTKFNTLSDGTGTVGAFTPGQTATFSAGTDAATLAYTVNVDTAVSTAGLTFQEGNVTLAHVTGGSLTLTAPAVDVATGATAVVSEVIGGTVGLTKTSAGMLTLSGANTYTGTTAVNGGILSVGSDANLGDATAGLSFNGGTLAFTAPVTSARAVALAGTGTVDTAANNVTLSGAIGGAGGLTKIGAGTLFLTNTNSYAGTTAVTAGTLSVAAGSLGGGNVSINGATLTATGANTVAGGLAIGAAGATIDTGANNLALNGNLTGGSATTATASAYTLVKNGTGTLTLGVTTVGSYLGAVTVNAGNVALVGNTAAPKYISQNADAVLTGGLTIGGTAAQAVEYEITRNNASVSGPGTLTVNPNSQLVAYGTTSATAVTGTVSTPVVLVTDGTAVPTIAGAQFGTLNVSGNITGNSGVQFGGTTSLTGSTYGAINSGSLVGRVVLSGTNTYTGPSAIAGGTVVANGGNSTGSGTVTINAPFTAGTTKVTPTLAGTGTVQGDVVVNGAISAGTGATASDAAGTLTTLGSQTWNNGGKYVAKFNSTNSTATVGTAGGGAYTEYGGGTATTWDTLSMSTLITSGGTFTIALVNNSVNAYTFAAGTAYRIATFTSPLTSPPDVAAFFVLDTTGIGIPNGTSGLTLAFNDDGTGLDVLGNGTQSTPEPTTAALFGLGAATLLGRRRHSAAGVRQALRRLFA